MQSKGSIPVRSFLGLQNGLCQTLITLAPDGHHIVAYSPNPVPGYPLQVLLNHQAGRHRRAGHRIFQNARGSMDVGIIGVHDQSRNRSQRPVFQRRRRG